jgi:ParB family chromosome partitioning protein
LTDREALEFGIIENVQREDLSPLEEADGYKRLLEEFGHTQDALAKIVGKSRPHITNMLRLLTLPEGVRQLINEGRITTGHARAIIPARNPLTLAHEIVRKGLNVRQAETLAKRDQENPEIHKKRAHPQEADVIALEKELEKVIGLKVKITTKGKSGTLTLHYTDLDQLDDIIKKLRT